MGVQCSNNKSTSVRQPKQKVVEEVDKNGSFRAYTGSKDSRTVKINKNGSVEHMSDHENTHGSKNKLNNSLGQEDMVKGTLNQSLNSHSTQDSNFKPFQYKKGPLIGRGTTSAVFECLNLSSGERLAVKSIKIKGDITKLSTSIESMKREIDGLRKIVHKNIIKYYMTEIAESEVGGFTLDIVFEYASGGSLRNLLNKFEKLDARIIKLYTDRILEGLAYLHFNEILHRDLKGTNVLLDADGQIKLSDIGSLQKYSQNWEDKTAKSPPYWTAPEVLKNPKSYSKASDIWSLGCVVLEMATGQAPWSGLSKDPEQVRNLILKGGEPPINSDIHEPLKRFMQRCFQQDPKKRPTALELQEDYFISQDDEFSDTDSYQTFQSNLLSTNFQGMLTSKNALSSMASNLQVNHMGTSNFSAHPSQSNTGELQFGKLKTLQSKEFGNNSQVMGQEGQNHAATHKKGPNKLAIPKSMAGTDVKKLKTMEGEENYMNQSSPELMKKHQTSEYNKLMKSNPGIIKELPDEEMTPVNNKLKPHYFADFKSSEFGAEELANAKSPEDEKEEARRKWEAEINNQLNMVKSNQLRQDDNNKPTEWHESEEESKEEKRKRFEAELMLQLKKTATGELDALTTDLNPQKKVEENRDAKRKKYEEELARELNQVQTNDFEKMIREMDKDDEEYNSNRNK